MVAPAVTLPLETAWMSAQAELFLQAMRTQTLAQVEMVLQAAVNARAKQRVKHVTSPITV